MFRQLSRAVRDHLVGSLLICALAGWLLVGAAGAGRPYAAVSAAAVVAVALGGGRRWPVAALGCAFAGLFLVDAVEGGRRLEDPMLAAVMLASFEVGRWGRLTVQPWAGAGVLLLLSVNVVQPGGGTSVGDAAFPILLTAGPWLLGLAVQLSARRERRAVSYTAELTDRRQDDIRRATDQERLRIAHELHDVVAHHLSGVSLQAQVARRRVEAGGEVSPAELAVIEQAARSALADLRRVLGVLRPTTDPAGVAAPAETLADLDELVEQCRRAGQDIRVRTLGTPRELPPALSLVAYRILQEALTNARRHGQSKPTSVQVQWLPGRLAMTVSNPYDGTPAEVGHGRLGMAERAKLFGGSLTTTASDGTWTVDVVLPTPATETEGDP
jgi:signal transduction histidine kinase